MAATYPANQNVVSATYIITIPSKPTLCCIAGYEFHVGLNSTDGKTAMKTTISYGCVISSTSVCGQRTTYLDRYIFYFSLINLTTKARTQYPSSGWVVTVGSTYSITLKQVAACSGQAFPAWVDRKSVV